ncbi:MAG: GtrA family protein [Hyphomonadaceae bacterium]|jgi:putative flippase GtrA|uniref:GtrA family protein n=1 Tax=Aquidulcibacter sp. TaxID=2052990 RepID=UPI0022C07F31|nr:GtrA family protein [Aquidulcibacter sp.]MCE2890797.1 GtrA family protein [Hyphomonadaceae bacterium]MCZ8207226.1 GtrA family protein [Aquidulcibacter sp.]
MTKAEFRAKAVLGFRYAVAGGLTSLVYIIVYNLMVYLGLVRFFSSNLAYGAALLFQYSAHGKFTFGHRETKPGTLWRYLIAVGVGFLIAALISQANTKLYDLPDLVVSAIVMVIVACTNFLFFNFWVYADHKDRPEATGP